MGDIRTYGQPRDTVLLPLAIFVLYLATTGTVAVIALLAGNCSLSLALLVNIIYVVLHISLHLKHSLTINDIYVLPLLLRFYKPCAALDSNDPILAMVHSYTFPSPKGEPTPAMPLHFCDTSSFHSFHTHQASVL